MSDPKSANPASADDSATYTVVARRYRPKSFQELVGQEHIAQALGKAIATGRVGHAYLFTGARGVGKTSSARIFAKALNAPGGPSVDPVTESDVSQAIDSGEDVDVIEIDAASNRGIDEIRQLRANVSVRPSRSRYKIYIIDEVHMLTNQAFNALLKTLEEPPEHVKFIFCTTDPEKVPITVLSRCQRFDFAPVRPDAIQQRLSEICQAEGFAAEDDALALLARRAAGSMRDSQSLLEQVMSFSSGQITVEQVHALLGTADETRLRQLAEALAARNGVAALEIVNKAIADGTDAGQFAEQMLGYLRDLMAVAVGGGPDLLKVCNPSGYDTVKQLATTWGLQTILSAVQLLDEALVRMRFSVQSQALFEVALIQISQLQDLASIAKLLEALQQGGTLPGMAASPAGARAAVPAPSALAPSASGAAAPTSAAEKKNAEGLDLSALRANRQASHPGSPTSPSPTTPLHQPSTEHSAASPTSATASKSPPAPTLALATAAPATEAPATEAPATEAPATEAAAIEAPATEGTVQSPATARTIQIQSAHLVAAVLGGSAATLADKPSAADSQVNASPEAQTALKHWQQAAATTEGMLADFAGQAIGIELTGKNQWTVIFPPGSGKTVDYCDQAARKEIMQAALSTLTGEQIKFGFRVQPGQVVRTVSEVPVSPTVARSQRMRQLAEHPLVSKLCELLQGEVVRVDPPVEKLSAPHTLANTSQTALTST